jgi:Flp pilus assembly protein TadD
LQKAIALRPAYSEALNNLGIVFVKLQQYAKAEEQFKAGMRLVPVNDQAYLNLARLYLLQTEKAKAIAVLQELIQLQPGNAAAVQALDMIR